MLGKLIILDSIQLQEKMFSLFTKSKTIFIISPFINFSKFFDYYTGESIKIATNFTKKIFERSSSDIDFFVKANEKNAEIKHIEKLHSKIYLFDDCIIIGSSNFTYGGLKNNIETNVLISKEDESFESIKKEALKLYKNGRTITKEDVTKMKELLPNVEFSKDYLSNIKEYYKDALVIIVRPSLSLSDVNQLSSKIFKKNEKSFELSSQIKKELKKSNLSYITFDSYKRLHTWCYQSSYSPYRFACEATKELCMTLFGYIIPEKLRGVAFSSKYINLLEMQRIKEFHEANLKF